MPLILITGTAGSGKSTVRRELQARGYEAHDIDEGEYAQWVHRTTKQVVQPIEDFDLHAWYKEHVWMFNREAIAALRKKAAHANKPIFLVGLAGSEEDKEVVWSHFDTVILLLADSQTLTKRITSRIGNDFGKHPDELREVLEWQDKHLDAYKERGAMVIDAMRSIEQVVDEIVEHVTS